MIKDFIKIWDSQKGVLEEKYKSNHPKGYDDIVKDIFQMMHDNSEEYCRPSKEVLHTIDDGDYQGSKIYLAPSNIYQPSKYYVCRVSYGSCSGCDTFQAIDIPWDDDEELSEQSLKDFMSLALHIVQNIKYIDFYDFSIKGVG